MKRNITIVCIFLFLAALLFCTSCTCYCDGDELRGCGYEWKNAFCSDGDGCLQECFCPSEIEENEIVGEEGVDYKAPVITYDPETNRYEVTVTVEILKYYYGDWFMKGEICFMQDGNLIGTAELKYPITPAGEERQPGEYSRTYEIEFNNFYNPDGGEIEYIVDRFYLISKVKFI